METVVAALLGALVGGAIGWVGAVRAAQVGADRALRDQIGLEERRRSEAVAARRRSLEAELRLNSATLLRATTRDVTRGTTILGSIRTVAWDAVVGDPFDKRTWSAISGAYAACADYSTTREDAIRQGHPADVGRLAITRQAQELATVALDKIQPALDALHGLPD